MNPLAALKDKLMIKPNVEDRERVAVVIKGVKKHRKPIGLKIDEQDKDAEEKKELIIVDETQKGYDRMELTKKLLESKKLKVTIKPVVKDSEEKKKSEPIPVSVQPKKIQKIDIKKQLVIEEDEEEEEENASPKHVHFEENVEAEVIPIKAPKKNYRRTQKNGKRSCHFRS